MITKKKLEKILELKSELDDHISDIVDWFNPYPNDEDDEDCVPYNYVGYDIDSHLKGVFLEYADESRWDGKHCFVFVPDNVLLQKESDLMISAQQILDDFYRKD